MIHLRIQVVTVADDGTEQLHDIAELERTEATIATLGLTLQESKQILRVSRQLLRRDI